MGIYKLYLNKFGIPWLKKSDKLKSIVMVLAYRELHVCFKDVKDRLYFVTTWKTGIELTKFHRSFFKRLKCNHETYQSAFCILEDRFNEDISGIIMDFLASIIEKRKIPNPFRYQQWQWVRWVYPGSDNESYDGETSARTT